MNARELSALLRSFEKDRIVRDLEVSYVNVPVIDAINMFPEQFALTVSMMEFGYGRVRLIVACEMIPVLSISYDKNVICDPRGEILTAVFGSAEWAVSFSSKVHDALNETVYVLSAMEAMVADTKVKKLGRKILKELGY